MYGLVGLAGSLIGDVMSQSGQSKTNEESMAVAQMNNATAIDLAKNAMTYRVADYKNAGLNPMLAAGGPGLQVPVMQQPNALQNPSAAFGNTGSQVTNAMQLHAQQSQIELNKQMASKAAADAANTAANTEQVIPAQVAKIQTETGLNQIQATQVSKNVQLLNWTLEQAPQKLAQTTIATHLMQADLQERQDTLLTLIKARNDQNFAASIGARNISSANDTEFGRIMAFFHLGQPAVSSALGVARTVGEFVP